MESEHTKGILIRNLTFIVTFSALFATFSKANFPQESSARFRFFFINNGIEWATAVACTCAEP